MTVPAGRLAALLIVVAPLLAASEASAMSSEENSVPTGRGDAYLAQLSRLRFLNSGTVEKSESFAIQNIGTIYNECYDYELNASMAAASASCYTTGGHVSYLYKQKAGAPPPAPPGSSRNSYEINATLCRHCDRGGADMPAPTGQPVASSFEECAGLCGDDPRCRAWVYNPEQRKCYKKTAVTLAVSIPPDKPGGNDSSGCSPSYAPADCVAGSAPAHGPPSPGTAIAPPSGMRSAVPLGCLGSTVELRGDGALRDWRGVFNNGPEAPSKPPDVWNHKISIEDAAFGFSATGSSSASSASAFVLRTQLPASLAKSGSPVDALTYQGAFPVARLNVTDSRLPAGLSLSLSGAGQFAPQSPDESLAPAVVFTFLLENMGSGDVDANVFFNLPNIIGATSYATSSKKAGMLTMGEGAASIHKDGGMSLLVDDADSWSWSSTVEIGSSWGDFASAGHLKNASSGVADGAVAATVRVPKGSTRAVTITLSWYFPHHIWAGNASDPTSDLGHRYAEAFHSSEHVAFSVTTNKSRSLQHALDYHATFLDTDLPPWLQDALLNSAAVFTKTSMYLRDGRFRMYESHSCSDLQPPHIHFYRAQALHTLFPTLEAQIPILYNQTQPKVKGDPRYAKTCPSCEVGAIFNSHGNPQQCSEPGCIDYSTDTSAKRIDNVFNFIMDVYQNVKGSEDGDAYGKSLYVGVKLALGWLIAQSGRYGVPEGCLNTNDEHGIMGDVGICKCSSCFVGFKV